MEVTKITQFARAQAKKDSGFDVNVVEIEDPEDMNDYTLRALKH